MHIVIYTILLFGFFWHSLCSWLLSDTKHTRVANLKYAEWICDNCHW